MLEACVFQPTLPARGATNQHGDEPADHCISTHAPRTGSDGPKSSRVRPRQKISTHAPRTGSDGDTLLAETDVEEISTHAPRTGSDQADIRRQKEVTHISTHAPRTGSDAGGQASRRETPADFNPRSPHGERPLCLRGLP